MSNFMVSKKSGPLPPPPLVTIIGLYLPSFSLSWINENMLGAVYFSSLSFLRTAMRVALPPLFLLISSKVINVVYSAALVCIPIDYVKQFGFVFFIRVLPLLNWVHECCAAFLPT